jgi:hypothetical protein
LAATGGGGIRINPARAPIYFMTGSESLEDIYKKIRGAQGHLRLWIDLALAEYLEKYDKDCYDSKTADSANILALKYLKQVVSEKIGDSDECALAVGIFASGYIDGRIMTAVYDRKSSREGFEYWV